MPCLTTPTAACIEKRRLSLQWCKWRIDYVISKMTSKFEIHREIRGDSIHSLLEYELLRGRVSAACYTLHADTIVIMTRCSVYLQCPCVEVKVSREETGARICLDASPYRPRQPLEHYSISQGFLEVQSSLWLSAIHRELTSFGRQIYLLAKGLKYMSA